jgi:hypothetical protein
MNRLVRGLGVLWVLAAVIGCKLGETSTPDRNLPTLLGLAGTTLRPKDVPDGQIVMFTCGCDDCISCAKGLAVSAPSAICIGSMDRARLTVFLKRTYWHGKAYFDPGSAFAISQKVSSCPVVGRFVNGHVEPILKKQSGVGL